MFVINISHKVNNDIRLTVAPALAVTAAVAVAVAVVVVQEPQHVVLHSGKFSPWRILSDGWKTASCSCLWGSP